MHYSLKQSLLAGASALVLGMGAAGAARAQNADADAIINGATASVHDNTAVDNGSVRNNRIENSNGNGAGIVHEQQNNGSNNAVSAATASTANLSAGATVGSTAFTTSSTHDNETVHHGYVPQAGAAEQPDRTNEIVGSFNGFDGIATVQQNNGDNNEIGAATANYGSAVSLGNVVQNATANAHTFSQGGEGIFDAIVDDGTVRSNLIDPTFNNSNGIATVQQNNGNANAISAATSVVATAGDAGDVSQFVPATANSDSNNAGDIGGTRSNEIQNSFVNANGVITVQQNNGDSNAMSAATAVFGAQGNAGSLNQDALAEQNNIDRVGAVSLGGSRSNLIDPSFNGANGTVTVQQNNGNVNQMAAATAVAGVAGNVSGNVSQDARANLNDVATDSPGFTYDITVDGAQVRDNEILNSFANNEGIITVQQNNGDGNTINAATAVAGINGAVGGDLSQNAQSDDARVADTAQGLVIAADIESTRSNTIDPSFQNTSGVITVQQNNGGANAMQASTAVAGAASVTGNVEQSDANTALNVISEPYTTDLGSDRDNAIAAGSFNNAAGTVTVQQNNGDANTMNAATTVVAVTGAVGGNLLQDADAEENPVSYSGIVATSSSTRHNAITSSFVNADGTIAVQQNNGNANSMNAATAVAAAGSVAGDVTQGDPLAANANDIADSDISDEGSTRGNDVTNAFNNVGGTTIVQQNNGTGNSLNSATAVLTTGVVGGDLSQNVDLNNNEVHDVEVSSVNTWRENNIDPSFTNAAGIHTVQQNNGDANTMNVGVAVASAADVHGGITQTVDASDAEVAGVKADDVTSVRHNLIGNSFDGADGIVTVQQNNGSANAMQAGTAVLRASAAGTATLDIGQTVDSGGTVKYSDGGVDDVDSDRNNAITGSFERSNGIVTVQENNGDSNVLSAATAVADLSGDFADFDDNLTQTVNAGGRVKWVDSDDDDTPSGTVDKQGDGGRYNAITSSFTNSAGTATVQQNNGSNNVLASSTGVMVAEAALDSTDPNDEPTEQSAHAWGKVKGSEGTHDSLGGHPPPYDRNNDLASSFNGFDGVATVQQNNGDNNVMASATAVAANFGNPLADDLSPVDASASTYGRVKWNYADDTASNRENSVGGSFRSASGIVTVQQNNGNNNVVAAATTVTANLDTAVPHADVEGFATGSADVHNNHADASDLVDRTNGVTASFGGFKGLANVQQNNGDNNVMGAATTVSASNAGNQGFGPAVSLASLNASVTGNTAHIAATNGVDPGYSNLVSGSFNNAAGVITVQQNTGSNNAIQSAISVTANFN